jgi:hypothetical protein
MLHSGKTSRCIRSLLFTSQKPSKDAASRKSTQ